jgi:hypothetical protein
VANSTIVSYVDHLARAECKCFEDQERSMEELKKLLIQTLFHWTKACSVPKISTMSQFLSLCSSFCL